MLTVLTGARERRLVVRRTRGMLAEDIAAVRVSNSHGLMIASHTWAHASWARLTEDLQHLLSSRLFFHTTRPSTYTHVSHELICTPTPVARVREAASICGAGSQRSAARGIITSIIISLSHHARPVLSVIQRIQTNPNLTSTQTPSTIPTSR
jgi:hypothetical protein